MERNNNERSTKIIEMIKELSKEEQEAIMLVIKHLETIEEICKNTIMTEDEIEKGKREAEERGDFFTLILYCAVEIFNRKR